MKRASTPGLLLTTLLAALTLAACGGGGDGVVTDPLISGTGVPTSATTSSAGAISFVGAIADGGGTEGTEPIEVGGEPGDIDAVVLATDDTAEPAPTDIDADS